MSDKNIVFPIDVIAPLSISLNQNTGELLVEFVPYGFADNRRMQLRIEPKALLEMMSVIPALEKDYGELIRAKTTLYAVQ